MAFIERVDYMFPRLASNLRAMIQYASSLRDCQAMNTLRQAKKFTENHPFISLFLFILVVLGFLPFLVFLAFVSGSFLFVSFSAVAVFGGTFAVALFSFLVVLFPVLSSGGMLAVFLYLTFCFVMRMQRIIKQFRKFILLKYRRLRNRRTRQ